MLYFDDILGSNTETFMWSSIFGFHWSICTSEVVNKQLHGAATVLTLFPQTSYIQSVLTNTGFVNPMQIILLRALAVMMGWSWLLFSIYLQHWQHKAKLGHFFFDDCPWSMHITLFLQKDLWHNNSRKSLQTASHCVHCHSKTQNTWSNTWYMPGMNGAWYGW